MKSMNNIIAFSISTLYNVRQSRLSTEIYFCNISYNKAKQPICLLYDMLSYDKKYNKLPYFYKCYSNPKEAPINVIMHSGPCQGRS